MALHYEPCPTSFLMVLMKEFTIRGSMEYPARFADAIDLLARRDLSALITHRFPLEQFDDALGCAAGVEGLRQGDGRGGSRTRVTRSGRVRSGRAGHHVGVHLVLALES